MEKSFLHKTGITGVMVFISLCFSACHESSNFPGMGMYLSDPENLRKIVSHDPERFESEHFRDPDSFYWPAYFWLWNDTVSRETISEQLRDMHSRGARSVCLHPLPRGFRPFTMFTRMDPDYLTPEYFGLYRYAIEECSRLGMKCYLYDEGGWPSGACLGRVVEQNPDLIFKQLARQVMTHAKGSTVSIPDSCIAAFLFRGSIKMKKLDPGTTLKIDTDSARVMFFTVKKGISQYPYPYPDLLNPRSTKEFLRLTHEEYKKNAGDYFGDVLKITFTDEAKAANPGWTDDFAAAFRERFGYDIRDELPSVFEGNSEKDLKVRIDYFDWWSRRNADAYYGQIQEWCHSNNLLSSGHLNGEDATEFARRYGYGHPLRALRRMDIPGIDVIWRQLWPGAQNHHFPKYASSVSHQSGMPWAMTESFGVYGSGLDPAHMKWVSDYQFVRGINLLVIGGYPLSQKDWFQGGIRPMFGRENPLWQYMDNYHAYIARLSYLLSLGKPSVHIAVYYPVRDIWAGGPDLDDVCASNDQLVKVLLENQCDFDFIDDDALEDRSAEIRDGKLVIGRMKYDVVCISQNSFMTDRSLKKLEELIKYGGKVFWTGSQEKARKPAGTRETTFAELPSLLTPTLALESPDYAIRVCRRELADGALYFITNEDTCSNTSALLFNESRPVFRLDPETGDVLKPSRAVRTQNGWKIPVELEFAESCVLIFTDMEIQASSETLSSNEVIQYVTGEWKGRKIRDFKITQHGMEVLDRKAEQPVNISPGEWNLYTGDSFSGDVEYTVKFNCNANTLQHASQLDLGDVLYVSQVWLNGEDLGKRIWKPFSYDIRGKIRIGENLLRVVVTNTLANQYTYTKELDYWPVEKLGPYHKRTIGYEKESLSGGLLGPVTIRY